MYVNKSVGYSAAIFREISNVPVKLLLLIWKLMMKQLIWVGWGIAESRRQLNICKIKQFWMEYHKIGLNGDIPQELCTEFVDTFLLQYQNYFFENFL